MAVTRIKNNQITDSTVTGSKLATKTITAGLLEDNLTYGSNLTISGNLTVNGTTTTVDTTNTLIADPLLVLSRGETGTPSADGGLIIERGTSTNVAFIWDESADVFAVVNTTEDGTTAGDITISSYADLTVANLIASGVTLGNIGIDGNTISSTDANGDINLTPNGSGEVVASTLSVSDLTSDRVVLAGASGALNDSANLTFNGSTLVVTGVANISTNLNVSGEATLASATVSDLTSGRVVLAGTAGAIEDNGNLTFNGTTLAVTGAATISTTLGVTGATTLGSTVDVTGLASLDGGIDVDGAFTVADTTGNIATSGTLAVTGESTLASATVSDLTSGRVVLAGTAGAIEDSGNLTFDGSTLTVTGDVSASGDLGGATATVSGNATVGGTLGVTGEATLASATVSDLTSGRVVLAGASGSLGDNANLTFNGTSLSVTGNVAIDNITIDGNTIVSSDTNGDINLTPNGSGEVVMSTATVSDLTDNRIVVAGTSGALEDDANLTWDGTAMGVTGGVDIAGDLDIDNINIDGNDITSTNSNGNINITPDGTGITNIKNLKLDGLAADRVLITDSNGTAATDNNLTWDGTDLGVTGSVTVDNITIDGDTISSVHSTITIDPSTAGSGGTVIIEGNLQVTGTTTTIDSTVVTIADPVFQLGEDSADSLDRGIKALYNDGAAKVAFFGLDDSATEFVFIADATDSSSVFAGSLGNAAFGSLRVTDLTSTRITFAGASGELQDSANLTFNGTTLTATALQIDNVQIDGNTITTTSGNLNIDSNGNEVLIDSLTINDLTSGRVLLAGTSGSVEDSGNLTFNGTTLAVTGAATVSTTLGVTGATTLSSTLDVTGLASLDGGIDVDGAFTVANTSGNISTSGTLAVTGESTLASATVSDLTSGRVVLAGTAGAIEDSGNLTFDGSTLTVTGDVSASGDLGGATATVSGNATVGGTLGVTGESTLASATVSDLTSGRVVLAGTAGAIEDSGNLTFDGTTLTVAGDVAIDNVTIDGNTVTTSAGGLTIDSFSGETTIADNATVSGTLDVTGATTLSSTLDVTGNTTVSGTLGVTGESTLASATVSDLTSGRVVLAGTAGAIEDSGNLTFDGTSLGVTGNVVVDNITIDGNSISSSNAMTLDAAAGQSIVINEAGTDVDVRIESDTQANAFFVEGSTGNIGIRTAAPSAGATLHINTTDSMIVPNGTTAQRPGTAAEGMMRYNSSLGQLEFYDSTEWKVAGAEFTIMVADSFNGDGSTVAFTISEDSTSAGLIVALNGVLQDPGTAYSVSGTTLTFTEAPANGDNIDARIITTTTQVTQIAENDTSIGVSDANGTAVITVNGTAIGTFSSSGLTVVGSLSADSFTGLDATKIEDGTSNIEVLATNGNIDVDVAGTNVVTFTASGADLKGVPTAPTATAGTNTTQIATTAFVSTAVSNLVDSAPAALDTLNELAAALGDDANFATTVNTALGNRLSSTATVTLTGDVTGTATFSANTASISATIAANSVALGTDTTGNYVAAGAVSGNGLSGSASAEGATFTVTSNATSANTGSTIVFRDASGNFSAGTITATATNAQYADLAENYTADAEYAPGTVVSFGGDAEVTVNAVDMDRKVAGVVSTDPAHLMNANCEGEHVVALALQGRVPCKVVGAVEKGDLMVAAGNGFARAETDPKVGTVIGKALEAHAGGEGVIEVAVGRF